MTRGLDLGANGVVPFRFACQRCGHCCSGGSGHVWIDENEVAGMARALEMSDDAFAARHVKRAHDPRTGELRWSLRERENEGGGCTLLVGRNTCSVYAARPAHCRTFPYWASVLEDRAGFEAARATCPGIAVLVDEERGARARERLAELYARIERELANAHQLERELASAHQPERELASANEHVRAHEHASSEPSDDASRRTRACCRNGGSSSALYVTALEADAAAHALRTQTSTPSGCAFGAWRPLGCRLDDAALAEEARERFIDELRALERELDYPKAYGELNAMLAARDEETKR